MGAAVESAFKDQFKVRLLSFPKTPLESGSFVADFRMELESQEALEQMSQWQPDERELRALSQAGQTIAATGRPFECLEVNSEEAKELIQDDCRMSCLAKETRTGPLTVYRIGEYAQVGSHCSSS